MACAGAPPRRGDRACRRGSARPRSFGFLGGARGRVLVGWAGRILTSGPDRDRLHAPFEAHVLERDRKSTRLNSNHLVISYAVFCLKKKKQGPPGDTGYSD